MPTADRTPKPTPQNAMDPGALVRPRLFLPPHSEVAVMRQRSFWGGLMFGFSASLTLWQDLPAVEALLVMIVLFGAALVLGSGE